MATKKAPAKKAAPAAEEKTLLIVSDHVLVPRHELCTEDEKRHVLARYKVNPSQLPRISPTDAAIRHLSCKQGDLIKITRQSETAGEAIFYRIVASE